MTGRFKQRRGAVGGISTGSMADISLLLLLFFMVTSVFIIHRGFAVALPRAERIDPIANRKDIVTVWIGTNGRIMVDEFDTQTEYVGAIVKQKLAQNPQITVLIKADKDTSFRTVSGVIEQLKKVNALKISFIADEETP